MSELLNIEQFAAALGVRPATVRQWVWMRKIPYLKVGRCVRFKRETLERLIQRSEVPALERNRA
jgi:excisionase family DNA binding protein